LLEKNGYTDVTVQNFGGSTRLIRLPGKANMASGHAL